MLYPLIPANIRRKCVFVFSEVKVDDVAVLNALVRGADGDGAAEECWRDLRFILCSRRRRQQQRHPATHDGANVPASGGVMVATYNKGIRLQAAQQHPAGANSVTLHVDGFAPLAITAVYIPPVGSTAASGNGDAISAACRIVLDTAAVCIDQLAVGDWNMRLARSGGRVTPDTTPQRDGIFSNFLRQTGMGILHGSPGQCSAYFTSRAISHSNAHGGSSEVDAFCVPQGILREGPARIQALPPFLSWHDIPSTMTHIDVAARFHMRRTATPQRTQPADALPPAVPRLVFTDRRNLAAADRLLPALQRAASSVGDTPATIDASYIRLGRDLHAIGDVLRAPLPARLQAQTGTQHGQPQHSGTARPHAPIQQLQKQLKCARAALATAKRDSRTWPGNREAALLNLRTAERALRSARRAILARRLQQHIRRLEALRINDPSAFFEEVQNLVMADGFSFPNQKAVASLEELYDFYKDKFKETRQPPPACPAHPDGAGSYDAHIPTERSPGAGARIIARPVEWTEVYCLLYPPTHRLLPHLTPCCADCALCTDYITRLRRWRQDDPDSAAPQHKPCLSTCRAAGADGLIAELLRFVRPPTGTGGDRRAVFTYRRAVSTALALILDRWLRHGVPRSGAFRDVLISTPAKPRKPGQAPAANPAADTRPISVEVLLAKVFELLLNTRAEHWRVHEQLVSPPQAAFSAFHSPEMHVLTLREMISMRRKAGADTYALFIDFKSAYDSVHHSMLWHVVRRMGFPESVIRVLADWYRSRTGYIKSGRRRSPPFPIDKGMPQGGPLSTLLWNLFIETLSRRLAQIPGVTVTRADTCDANKLHLFKLTHLLFADDLVILAESPEALREALRITAEWAAAFGCTVNDGVGKTEAMCFTADPAEGEARRASLQPMQVNVVGHPPLCIRWVSEYRYLGAQLNVALSVERTLNARIAMLDAVISSTFTYNRVLSNLGCHAQTQLFNTLAMAAINYLIAVLPMPAALAAKVDARTIKVARRIFGAPRGAPAALLKLEMPGTPFHATCTMRQAQLLFSLQLSPIRTCIATDLIRFQLATFPPALPRSRGYVPFAQRVLADIAELRGGDARNAAHGSMRTLPPLQPTHRLDVHRQAAVFRRAHAYLSAISELPMGNVGSRRLALLNLTSAATQPPAVPPMAHMRVLYHAGSHLAPLRLGAVAAHSPMSAAGPGCGGALLAVTAANWTLTSAVIRLRMGRLAFAYAPFSTLAGDAEGGDSSDSDSEGCDSGGEHAQRSAQSKRRRAAGIRRIIRYRQKGACPLCDADGRKKTDDGPWHLTQECDHPRVVTLRQDMLRSLRRMLLQMLRRAHRMQERAGVAGTDEEQAAATAQLLQLTTPDRMTPTSPDTRHVAFHMLTAIPWTATVASEAAAPLSRWLGRLFDSVLLQRRFRRGIANIVVQWSSRWIKAFARTRGELLK